MTWVGAETQTFERTFDGAKVEIGLDVGDEQHVDVGGTEVFRNDACGISCQNVRDEPTKDDHERIVFAQLVQ